jgi:hypothetical protein
VNDFDVAPLIVHLTDLEKFLPVESSSNTYLLVNESLLEYLGFVQLNVTTVVLESAAVGAKVDVELLNTGETPVVYVGNAVSLLQATRSKLANENRAIIFENSFI